MDFQTPVSISKPTFTFSYSDQILLLGSCFAENIGSKLTEKKFMVDINPFGILYNPASVAVAVRSLLNPTFFTVNDLFFHEEVYHSFMHHSRFSSISSAECLKQINERLDTSSQKLKKATRLVITLGSSYVYRLKTTGEVVANCHKLPDSLFERSSLSVTEIVKEWEALINIVQMQNPDLKILFTVSPIRHWKDGAHGNQLSKARLLLAIDKLINLFPNIVSYFPAYEIQLDELRDYRFYAEDMIHPSTLAVEYIWNRFSSSHFTPDTLSTLTEWGKIQKSLTHKPLHPNSKSYQTFLHQTLLKMDGIQQKFPSFDITDDINWLKSKIK